MDFLETLFGQPGSAQSQSVALLLNGLAKHDLSGGLLAASQYTSPEAQARRQMGLLQLQEAQGKVGDQQRQRDFLTNLPSPQFQAGVGALAAGGGPTNANAARIPPVSPMQDLLYQGVKAGAVPFTSYAQTLAPKEPIKLGAGESLLDHQTYKPLFTNPTSRPRSCKSINSQRRKAIKAPSINGPRSRSARARQA
jgi:hypothetical protein